MSMSWVAKLFCCASEKENRHIPTPSKRQIKLWEEREKELKVIKKQQENRSKNER